MATHLLLSISGFIAGLIDSIAGGGGLITLPVLSEVIEPGANAIGTNKIVGFCGAAIAFLVYLRRQPLRVRAVAPFLVTVFLGAALGSVLSPFLPKAYFRYLMIAACPLLLWMVWNRKMLTTQAEVSHSTSRGLIALLGTGLVAGFYDGFFGPGGGTVLLLGLLWAAKLPLFEALLFSKLANSISAGTALISYGLQGYVHVKIGLTMAAGMTLGGLIGAKFASKKSEKVVRPALVIVVVLLMISQLRAV